MPLFSIWNNASVLSVVNAGRIKIHMKEEISVLSHCFIIAKLEINANKCTSLYLYILTPFFIPFLVLDLLIVDLLLVI